MSEILPNLWLGPIGITYDYDFLKGNNIRRIVTIYEEYHRTPVMYALQIQTYHIKMHDRDDAPIGDSLEDVTAFIDQGLRKNEGVYVHCYAGISRSPTIVAAYLMRHGGLCAEDALQYIKERRPIISPNDGFCKALLVWGEGLK